MRSVEPAGGGRRGRPRTARRCPLVEQVAGGGARVNASAARLALQQSDQIAPVRAAALRGPGAHGWDGPAERSRFEQRARTRRSAPPGFSAGYRRTDDDRGPDLIEPDQLGRAAAAE